MTDATDATDRGAGTRPQRRRPNGRSRTVLVVLLQLAVALTLPVGGSSATADTTTPVGTSPKKGVTAYAYHHDQARLAALGASWFYSWSDVGQGTADREFVPMVWGGWTARDAGSMAALKAGADQGRYRHLLGFNEPDHGHQANMSVDEALSLWPALEATGLRLGSPAPANYWNGWLDRFMTGAIDRGYRVDFIALHYYPDFTDPRAAQRLIDMVDHAWNKWHKPVWITELGAIDIRLWGVPSLYGTPSHEVADTFIRDVTARLEADPRVERYAWFIDNGSADPSAAYTTLYDAQGRLTSHGSTYAAVGSPVAPPPVTDPTPPDPRVGEFRVVNPAGDVALHATWDTLVPEAADGVHRVAASPAAWRSSDQHWAVKATRSGYYRITSTNHDGTSLQVVPRPAASRSRTARLVTAPSVAGDASQLWRVVALDGGGYRIVSRSTGLALKATTTTYGTYTDVYHAVAAPVRTGSARQVWRLVAP